MPLMKPIAINAAEGILDPLWDMSLSGFRHWRIDDGAAHGLRVQQNWCNVTFEWARKPASGPALRMTRAFNADCSGYDALMVSVMAPKDSVFRMTARTDRGVRAFTAPPAPELKKEHLLPLDGATVLHELTLEVDAASDQIVNGWFNWVGVQNSRALERVTWVWDRFDSDWQNYLVPESYEPKFEPTHGMLIDKQELEQLRVRHEAHVGKFGESPFTRAADLARQQAPERMVRDFVNFWGDTRYCRERDHGNVLLKAPFGHAVNCVIAGLLTRDKSLLRLGARYAMALAMCGRWDDGMICYMPGGVFEHRCFVQSLCVHELAICLDLAGEVFTPAARDFIHRRIAEEGLGAINFNTWKYEYIFHCNQLAWFSPGRMAGYTLLEKSWPRAKPYTDLAYNDLIESLSYAILPDGGYVEGPTYFRCVARDGGISLYYYAKARGKSLADILPPIIQSTADFGAAVASTDLEQDVIPICDAGNRLEQEALAVMSLALPQSQWVTMFRKSLARTNGMADTLLACKLDPQVPAAGPAPSPFVFLPEMGLMTSTRFAGEAPVKILLMGNKAGAGHTHEDKGHFVLEYNGETFAMDAGTCDYSSPLAGALKNCERHNMLIPTGTPERPAPQCPLRHDVKPVGSGDQRAFHATLDATPGWTHYRKWVRRWDSDSPDTLTITDEFDLARGTGVEFLWHTTHDVAVTGHTIVLRGKRGKATLEAPANATIRVEDLPMPPGRVMRRIAIGLAQTSGVMRVSARLE